MPDGKKGALYPAIDNPIQSTPEQKKEIVMPQDLLSYLIPCFTLLFFGGSLFVRSRGIPEENSMKRWSIRLGVVAMLLSGVAALYVAIFQTPRPLEGLVLVVFLAVYVLTLGLHYVVRTSRLWG